MLPLAEFLERLSQSGVLNDRARDIVNALNLSGTEDTDTVAAELVDRDVLTPFQASALRDGMLPRLLLGDYLIVERIGGGGMGEVFKAVHRHMARTVALKIIKHSPAGRADAADRFRREVQAAAQLSHENIVRAYDAGVDEGIPYLVMEYRDGCDLARHVREQGPIPWKTALGYIIQAARGLDHAHRHGILHRDVKPGNMLLDDEGTIKVLDLGLAAFQLPRQSLDTNEQELTQSGALLGTEKYMAPEQAENAKNASPRSDIYSLGCTLYTLLTGRPLYDFPTRVEMLIAHRQHPVPDLPKEVLDSCPQLGATFRRMVAKEPGKRYASMGEVISDLESCLHSLPRHGETVTYLPSDEDRPPALPSISRSLLRRRRTWIGAAAILGVLVAMAIYFERSVFPQDRSAAEQVLKLGGTARIKTADGSQQDVRLFANLPKEPFELQSAQLTSTELSESDLSQIAAATRLTELVLAQCSFSDSALRGLRGQSSLIRLQFNHAKNVDDTSLYYLSQLPSLTDLELSGTQVAGPGLRHFANRSNLRRLYLAETLITDDALKYLQSLPALERLDLRGTRVTNSGLDHLRRLPALRYLVLSDTKIDDRGLVQLQQMKQLQQLYISQTGITVEGYQRLRTTLKGCTVGHDSHRGRGR